MTAITLKKPVTHDGKVYTEVVIDEPSIGAIEAFEAAKAEKKGDTAATIAMLAVDLEWPIEAVRKIKASDMLKISEALSPFVEAAGSTGGSSQPTSPQSSTFPPAT